MKKITINGLVCEYNTREELADLMAVMSMGDAPVKAKSSGKATKGKGKSKSQPKADKPTTRAEALAKWEADKGITPESKAKYKALCNSSSEFYKALWDARVNDKTYVANVKKLGKSGANKAYHKHICELASIESKK